MLEQWMKPGARVRLSQECRHDYAREATGTIVKALKKGELKVRLDSGKDYWALTANARPLENDDEGRGCYLTDGGWH